jgi:general secretion pathway protein C
VKQPLPSGPLVVWQPVYVHHNATMFKASSFAHSAFPGENAPARSAGRKPLPAVLAGLLWLAAGLSAGYWVLQALGRAPVTPVPAAASAPPVVDAALLARALGALPAATLLAQATPAAASRYALQGVVAVGAARGAALIAVDGQPARPFRLGAEVASGLVLQAVTAQQVRLGVAVDGPTVITLDMPSKPGG